MSAVLGVKRVCRGGLALTLVTACASHEPAQQPTPAAANPSPPAAEPAVSVAAQTPPEPPAAVVASDAQQPNAAEDTDGFQDTDGCPDPDNDNDGVPDELDECGEEPEIKNGFKDEDGCPDSVPDADKDGIPDNVDKCPTRPETFNGRDDEDGCPEAGPSLVDVKEEEIRILQRVEFETGSDKIKGATSFAVLDAVIGALKVNQQIFLVEVAGHTDNSGDAKLNKDLSQKRADAVKKYMVDKGIAETRLRATGYGQEKPISDNNTAAGKQKNRRVEFNIVHSTTKKPPAPAPAQPAPAPPAPQPAP